MKRINRGGTMVYVLLVITVLMFAGLGASTISAGSLSRARADWKNSVALNAAQATLELGLADTLKRVQDNDGEFETGSYVVSPDIDPIAPGCVASYRLQPSAGDSAAGWITATVTFEGREKSIRGYVHAKDIGIWNNAAFAGSGASGHSINGNVDIRGSVHILGEGEPYTDTNGDGVWTGAEKWVDQGAKNGVWDPGEPFTDTNGDNVWTAAEPYNDLNKNGIYDDPLIATEISADMSGGGMIGNNYTGMDSTFEGFLASPPIKNGLETLSSEVRVKHGKFSISGTATAGQDGLVDNGTSKGKLDGVYVNDGYAGNKGASSVYSDNGTSNAYDIADDVGLNFPVISGTGAKEYEDVGGGKWATHETYLAANCLDLTEVPAITAATESFTKSDGINSITFVKATTLTPALLTINGVVKVKDGFQLGVKDTIRFAGNGTFWSPGDINIDGNFLPAPGLKFPRNTKVGFIAKNSINIAAGEGSAQLQLMGAFYAQNRIYSAKQNTIAGTFVSNYFDMGTNVPKIYQVPTLKNNLPPAMPGADPIIWLKLRGWRERK